MRRVSDFYRLVDSASLEPVPAGYEVVEVGSREYSVRFEGVEFARYDSRRYAHNAASRHRFDRRAGRPFVR